MKSSAAISSSAISTRSVRSKPIALSVTSDSPSGSATPSAAISSRRCQRVSVATPPSAPNFARLFAKFIAACLEAKTRLKPLSGLMRPACGLSGCNESTPPVCATPPIAPMATIASSSGSSSRMARHTSSCPRAVVSSVLSGSWSSCAKLCRIRLWRPDHSRGPASRIAAKAANSTNALSASRLIAT